MNVVPVNSMLLVEQFDKGRKRSEGGSPFVSVIASANLGIVKYSSDENYPAGTQIYYGNVHHKLIVEGSEVLVMKVDNVVAKLLD